MICTTVEAGVESPRWNREPGDTLLMRNAAGAAISITAVTASATAANRQMPLPTARPASSGLPSPSFWPSSTGSANFKSAGKIAPFVKSCSFRIVTSCKRAKKKPDKTSGATRHLIQLRGCGHKPSDERRYSNICPYECQAAGRGRAWPSSSLRNFCSFFPGFCARCENIF